MSTRSGKKIHSSFLENNLESEPDIPKDERKTRSKHTKENAEESQPFPKPKKRNYVAYPGDDLGGVDSLDGKDEGRATRALRKNALKERNYASSTESLETPIESKPKPDPVVRSTRRTRKFAENTENVTEAVPQDEEKPKPKKDKKKKRKAVREVEEENLSKQQKVELVQTVPKKKSKKKKGRRSSSIIVEDIIPEAASTMNKSNMSVDSFHSAAGSPPVTDNEAELQKEEDMEKIVKVKKTRSSVKLDILTHHGIAKKQPRSRKSSVKVDPDDGDTQEVKTNIIRKSNTSMLPDSTNNEAKKQLPRRKSSVKVDPDDVDTEEVNTNIIRKSNTLMLPDTNDEAKDSTFDVEEKLNKSTRKSRNATLDKTLTPNKIDTTFDKDTTKKISDETFNSDEVIKLSEENVITEKDMVVGSLLGKRRSAINAMIQIQTNNNRQTPAKSNKRKSITSETFDRNTEEKTSRDKNNSIADTTYISAENSSPVTIKEVHRSTVDTTFDKEQSSELDNETKKNDTFDLTSSPFKSAYEVSSPVRIDDIKRKSLINTTYEKDYDSQLTKKAESTDITTIEESFQKPNDVTRKSSLCNSLKPDSDNNSTFDIDQDKKLDTTFDKNSKSSLLTSDSSMITLDKSNTSRISITSDESKNEENILNATPVLIESSLDESLITVPTNTTPVKNDTIVPAVTPLKREGTFTKDGPEVEASPKPKTPTKRMSLPSPGFTPFHINKSSSKEKSVLMNVTRSIEKRRSSLIEPPRNTKVMFCSPMNNPVVVNQIKKKVIKSNLKGSNKSFVFDESASVDPLPASRKRSYTHGDADDARVKRKRLATDLQQSVDRLSRPRTSSASAKLAEPTTPSKKPATPSKKSEGRISRTKLPNFAAMHQKRFEQMESLGECQLRKARRARQLLTPNGAAAMLDRISPKDKVTGQEKPPAKSKESSEKPKEAPKPETPIKSLPTFKSLNPGYTRFGFKLNLDVNPFSIPSKPAAKPKENKPNGLTRQATLPSLAGATSLRREVAKQTVMREKSFTDRRNEKRTENRTVIKGVRTNRRFELQMRMRDI